VHRHVGFVSAVHPQHSNELFVGRGIASQSHQGWVIGNLNIELIQRVLATVAQNHAAPRVDHRTFRAQQ
jgi:hypothetical protein